MIGLGFVTSFAMCESIDISHPINPYERYMKLIESTPLMDAIHSRLRRDGITSRQLRTLFARIAKDLCRLLSPLSRNICRNKTLMLKYLSYNWQAIDPIYYNILEQIPADIHRIPLYHLETDVEAHCARAVSESTPLMDTIYDRLCEGGINSQYLRILFAQIAASLCKLSSPVGKDTYRNASTILKHLSDNWPLIEPEYENIAAQTFLYAESDFCPIPPCTD
jgi:hypothetical protein